MPFVPAVAVAQLKPDIEVVPLVNPVVPGVLAVTVTVFESALAVTVALPVIPNCPEIGRAVAGVGENAKAVRTHAKPPCERSFIRFVIDGVLRKTT